MSVMFYCKTPEQLVLVYTELHNRLTKTEINSPIALLIALVRLYSERLPESSAHSGDAVVNDIFEVCR